MSATVMYHQSWLDSVQFYTRKNFYEILESGLVELFDGTEKKEIRGFLRNVTEA